MRYETSYLIILKKPVLALIYLKNLTYSKHNFSKYQLEDKNDIISL